jgi:diaminohydroxyphosphoribosylaminopyrimidine deaminase/5-amino-6-(5-phosphoribosylamino)uracil reductase
MWRCLQLAKLGAGNVAPNPMVGAVLVYNDTIIGEGYHMQYGQAHAEVNCINSVKEADKDLIKQSTLYVSLEPCNHFGKTPPCADLIVKNNIPHVVIACKDPFEAVNGSGIKKMKAAGIKVTEAVLEKEATDLNKRFFTFHTKKRPYIFLKWAQSADHKIAKHNFEAVKISNDITKRLVHKMRSREAAILVGTNTALHDNPALTNRLWAGKNLTRIVLDRFLKLPTHLNIFDDSAPTIIINTGKQAEHGNVLFYKINEKENIIKPILDCLFNLKLTSLIVEGGAMLLQSFIDAGMWDETIMIANDEINIDDGIDAPHLKNEHLINTEKILSDTIRTYSNKNF